MNILEGLNEGQLAAVMHNEGPLLVVAGAGTGKTQVITRRIARLIHEGKAKPTEILALTFTDKAASEMADRLEELIGWDAVSVPVMTFHAFGSELNMLYASHIGRSVRGGLLSEMQKTLLLMQHMDGVSLSYYGGSRDPFEFMSGIVSYIGALQNQGVTLPMYQDFVQKLHSGEVKMHPQDIAEQTDLLKIYDLYERLKQEKGVYDYSDQLALPLQVLRQRPNISERLRNKYKYILVDEYQDTNAVQDALLHEIIGATGNLFAVGDDDQAIYGFRGADIKNILSFVDHFKVEVPLALTENYRSGQEILDAAYRLIQHNNPDRLEISLQLNKRLHGQKTGSTATYTPYLKSEDELKGVVQHIQTQIASGESAGSIAVLSRTHAPLKQLAKRLNDAKLPFALSTQVSIFEQTELIQLWHVLQWIAGKANQDTIVHIALGPYVGISQKNIRSVAIEAKESRQDIEKVMRTSNIVEIAAAMEQLDQWRDQAQRLPVGQLAYNLVFETGLAERLQQQASEQPGRILRVFEDLNRLIQQMKEFEEFETDRSLMHYLEIFPLPPELEVTEPLGDANGVQLLTVHASKGLEFETVYLIGATGRSWSGKNGGLGYAIPEQLRRKDELSELHELRRLMYVAVTRAKNSLNVSSATHTTNGIRQAATVFVSELDIPEKQAEKVEETTTIEQKVIKLQRLYPLEQVLEEKRLPFETADGWLELSVTSLEAYTRCPYDFYLQHVLGIHQPFGAQLSFGTTLHSVFEIYLKAKLSGENIPLAELLDALEQRWDGQGYDTDEIAAAEKYKAIQTIQFFWEREEASNHRITGSEISFKFEVPEAKLRLRGKIDATFETPEGVELRDFKTGRKNDAEKLMKDAKENIQLRTYALAFEEMTGKLPHAVTLDYVVTGVEGSAELTPLIIKRHREKLIQISEQIREWNFQPKSSSVHECAAIKYYGKDEGDEDA